MQYKQADCILIRVKLAQIFRLSELLQIPRIWQNHRSLTVYRPGALPGPSNSTVHYERINNSEASVSHTSCVISMCNHSLCR